MAAHSTDALIVETGSAAESLPDAATVTGRTHDLTNTSTAAVTWSTAGAGFTENGASVTTITVAAGATKRVQAGATRWLVVPPAGTRRIFSGKATSDASGNATYTFTPPFTTVPVVAQAVETATTNVTEARITALTTSSCTVNVRQSPAVVVLGISVLQVPQALAGATVHLTATEAGQG